MTNTPEWLLQEENYKPLKDNNNFSEKSSKTVVRMLSVFRHNSKIKSADKGNTSLRLFGMILIIILTSISKNYSFSIFMISLTLLRIMFLKGEEIKSLFKVVIPALILSFFILLPSLFLGNPKSEIIVLSKIFICSSMVMVVNLTSPFNEITRTLKRIHIPDILIFIFDTTIKHIYLLGEICYQMLNALKVRAIGKSNDKKASISGIVGSVFIKAKETSRLTSMSMECRGFDGEYKFLKKKYKFQPIDLVLILSYLAITGIFIYLEVIL